MKVAHVITRIERSGPNRVMQDLAAGQSRTGLSVVVVSLQGDRDDPGMIQQLERSGVLVYRMPKARNMSHLVRCLKEVSEQKIDIYHAHCLRSLFLLTLAGLEPRVATSHNIPEEDWPHTLGPAKGKPIAALNYFLLKRVSAVATINSRMQCAMERRGIESYQLNNPVDLPVDVGERRLGQAKRLISVGHLNSRKNPMLLIEALRRLGSQGAGITLEFVGDGPMAIEVYEAASSIHASVVLHGFQQDPAPYFRQADAYLSASLSEGMPISVLEALSFGLPCLLSNIPGHMFSGAPDSGIYYSNTDPAEFSESLRTFLFKEFVRPDPLIREWIGREFTPDAVARNYADIYEAVVSKGLT